MRFAKPRLFVRNATTFTAVNASPSTTTVSSAPFVSAKWLRARSRSAPAFVLLFALCKPSSGSRLPVPFSISLGELCSPSTAPCTKEPSGAADGTGNELRFRDGSHGRNLLARERAPLNRTRCSRNSRGSIPSHPDGPALASPHLLSGRHPVCPRAPLFLV